MGPLIVLLAAALALLALGAVGRVAPRMVPAAQACLCLGGLVAAVAAVVGRPVATSPGWLAFGVDGLSGPLLAALFLGGLVGHGTPPRSPVATGSLALAMLAADGAALLLGVLGALAAGLQPGGPRRLVGPAAALACLVLALLLLGRVRPSVRRNAGRPGRGPPRRAAGPGGGRRGGAAGAGHAGPAGRHAGRVPGRAAAAGPVGTGDAGVVGRPRVGARCRMGGDGRQRRRGGPTTWLRAGACATTAALGIGAAGIGAALLARGADLLPLAALAVAGGLAQCLFAAVWGTLLALATRAVSGAVGGTGLPRMGGLLRRAPGTGLALLAGLSGMAALPLTAGFAGVWMVLQALFGTARTGGPGPSMLVAAGVAALGLALALLAAAAVRLGGAVLLGPPRTAKAAGAVEPRRALRLGLGALTVTALLLGLCPGLVLPLVQPGARLLTGVAAEGAGLLSIGGAVDAMGYAAPAVAALLAAGLAAAAWLARGHGPVAAPWQGGFAEDDVGRGNTWPVVLPWKRPLPDRGVAGLALLALALAAAVGWAVR